MPIILFVLVFPVKFSGRVMSFLCYSIGRHTNAHKIAKKNIKNALDVDDEQTNLITKKSWYNLGYIAGELFYWRKLSKEMFVRHIELQGEISASPKGRIFLSIHYGNWEILLHYLTFLNRNVACLYRNQNNPYLNWVLKICRNRNGLKLINRKNLSLRKLIDHLNCGNDVGMLIDHASNNGIMVKLFHKQVMCSSLPAKLAIKYNFPIFLAIIKKTKTLTYKIKIHRIEIFDKSENEIMQEIYNIIEDQIRMFPDQWMWQYNRWR